jgi:SAM-dependent methyltransferase
MRMIATALLSLRTLTFALQWSTAMGLYQDWVVPTLTDLSMRNKRLRPYRERVAGAAEGRVLDVGIGSGLNLPLYGQRAREVFGLDLDDLLSDAGFRIEGLKTGYIPGLRIMTFLYEGAARPR